MYKQRNEIQARWIPPREQDTKTLEEGVCVYVYVCVCVERERHSMILFPSTHYSPLSPRTSYVPINLGEGMEKRIQRQGDSPHMEAMSYIYLKDTSENRSAGNQLHAFRVIACGSINSAVENVMNGLQKSLLWLQTGTMQTGPYL